MINKVLDFLYPPSLYCICCGNLIDETRTYNLCDHCIRHIKWDGDDAMERNGMKMLRCAEYGIYERTLIFSLKYNGKKYIARDLGKIMADRLALAQLDFDIIVPVPMHKDKEKARGFNHAALMGKYLGEIMGKPHCADALQRIGETLPMRGLNPTQRRQNVKGKFALNEKYGKMLSGMKVLLIDDFFTTGSTAEECQQVLLTAQPAEVIFLAFAARYELRERW